MGVFDREIDITRNIKTIEWLKGELLTDVANLFKFLANGVREEILDSAADTIANIILESYILGRRLGVSYQSIEMKVEGKLKIGIIEKNDIENYYGDLSELSKHLSSSRNKRKD
jgi:hypothetical protein